METPALFLVIATLLPLASFVLLLFAGMRMGRPLAGWVGPAAIGLSFVCSVVATMSWLGQSEGAAWGAGNKPINKLFHWLPVAVNSNQPQFLDVGIYVDSLTIAMFGMITFVATLVHVFSIGYMRED